MHRGARWWWRRLLAMSPREVVQRSARFARYPLEVARMRAGRYPRVSASLAAQLDAWTGPQSFYISPAAASQPVTRELEQMAMAICQGKRELLGLGWISVPDPPWHWEPNAGASWPMVDAARVRSSAPVHLDPRLTWELNRGHEWVVLARVYAATRDARLLARLALDIESWKQHNPIGRGINWVSPMEAAIRIHALAWTAALLRGTPGTALMSSLARLLYEHAVFVADHLSFGSSANNHLLVELAGLVVASRALDGAGVLHSLRPSSLARLDSEVARQVHADGVNAEMATHYHAFVHEALRLVAALERACGEPRDRLERTCEAMARYLAAVRAADGALLVQGDDDDGRIVPACAIELLPREQISAPTSSLLFRDSGQVVLRDPRLLASFDAGPFGFGTLAAHAHCDCLSVNVAIDGQPFLVDRGTYRYNGDAKARKRFRMTAAHNTVQVGSREQGDPAGPFLWSRQPAVVLERCELAAAIDVVSASHDGFAPARHRRRINRRDSRLLIVDELEGDGPQLATHRLHLAPSLVAVPETIDAGTAFRVLRGASPAGWIWISGPARLVETLHSPRYGACGPASTIECDVTLGGDRSISCVVSPEPVADPRALFSTFV